MKFSSFYSSSVIQIIWLGWPNLGWVSQVCKNMRVPRVLFTPVRSLLPHDSLFPTQREFSHFYSNEYFRIVKCIREVSPLKTWKNSTFEFFLEQLSPTFNEIITCSSQKVYRYVKIVDAFWCPNKFQYTKKLLKAFLPCIIVW